jgi:THO complex subunit 2
LPLQLLTKQISPLLYSCSENEARNYGLSPLCPLPETDTNLTVGLTARFLFDLLGDVYQWYKSEDKYKAEVIGPALNGFLRAAPLSVTVVPTADQYITHESLQSVTDKWHSRMGAVSDRAFAVAFADRLCYRYQGFKESFESGEYMHIKNSILVLTKIAPYFPIDYSVGIKLEKSVADLILVEKREDLKILAQGYVAIASSKTIPPVLSFRTRPATDTRRSSPSVGSTGRTLPWSRL